MSRRTALAFATTTLPICSATHAFHAPSKLLAELKALVAKWDFTLRVDERGIFEIDTSKADESPAMFASLDRCFAILRDPNARAEAKRFATFKETPLVLTHENIGNFYRVNFPHPPMRRELAQACCDLNRAYAKHGIAPFAAQVRNGELRLTVERSAVGLAQPRNSDRDGMMAISSAKERVVALGGWQSFLETLPRDGDITPGAIRAFIKAFSKPVDQPTRAVA